MIHPQLLRRQPDPEADCGLYALQNLYVWAGLEPPEVDVVRRALAPAAAGVSLIGMFEVLTGTRFPRFVSLGVVPAHLGARELFPALLDAGCALLVQFVYQVNGRHYRHLLVAVGHAERGLYCLDSTCPSMDGKEYPLVYDERRTDAECVADYKATLPFCDYGARVWLPLVTMGFDEWEAAAGAKFVTGQTEPVPFGIDRAFLLAAPL